MDTSPSMDTLPIEIITHIMKHLRQDDKHRATLVCKKWYKASIDPSVNRNVFFILRCDDDEKPPANEVLEGIGRRNIRSLRIYYISYKVYSEVRNWSGYKSITNNITTIEMNQFATMHPELFFDILVDCSNIQTMDMYVHTLLTYLQWDTRDKMIGVLTDLSHFILNVDSGGTGPRHIGYFMTLLKVVDQVKISRADLRENRSSKELAVSLDGLLSFKITLSTLRLFCEKYGCPLSIGMLNCSKNEIRLALFLGVLRWFPKLKVESLFIKLYSISELNDVNQLSSVNVNSLNLKLDFNTNEWFTRNSLASLVSASPLLEGLFLSLSVQEGTLDCILEGLPKVYLVEVGQCPFIEYSGEPNPIPENRRRRYVQAFFRTERDRKSKFLEIRDTNIQKVLIGRTSLTFSNVHPYIQIFVLTGIFTFQDSDFVLKLITCFPGLTTVRLDFEKTGAEVTEIDLPNQIDLSLFSRLKELQVLWLRINSYLAKIKMNGLQFPGLKELNLSGCVNLTNKCLREIGRSMPSLEYLNVSHCLRIGDVGLQSVLNSLTHLRELDVTGCEQVNSTTLKMISNCSASLKILWVSIGNAEFMAAIKKIHKSRSNLKIDHDMTRKRKSFRAFYPCILPAHASVSTMNGPIRTFLEELL